MNVTQYIRVGNLITSGKKPTVVIDLNFVVNEVSGSVHFRPVR